MESVCQTRCLGSSSSDGKARAWIGFGISVLNSASVSRGGLSPAEHDTRHKKKPRDVDRRLYTTDHTPVW